MTSDAQWDLFRTFEAIVRRGSFTAAAKALGLSQSSVSRHLARLEADAGAPLLARTTPVHPTARGAALLAAILPMVDAATVARATLASTPELRGQITITTVGEVVRWALTPALGAFYRAYPELRLRILADNQVRSLAADEADIALRLARPARGEVYARKLRVETYGLFAAATLLARLPRPAELPWLGLTGSLAQIAEQRHAERAFASRPPRLLVEDVESLGHAIQAGMGVGVLPRGFAARLSGVDEVRAAQVGARELGPIPSRALWLVVHRRKRSIPGVRAVIDWLEATLARA